MTDLKISKTLLLVFLLLLKDHILLVSCQEDVVYRGTGVDYKGRNNTTIYNNQTVILGGLFSIHSNEKSKCDRDVRINPVQYSEAMALAVNRINNDTHFLPGVTLGYEIRDTCILPNFALEQTLSFITTSDQTSVESVGVSGVVGTTFSSTTIPVASLLRLFRIPLISYAATAEVLSDKSRFDYFFRTLPPDSLQARAITAVIIKFNWTCIIAIHSDDDYGKGGMTILQNELQLANLSSHICLASVIPIWDSICH